MIKKEANFKLPDFKAAWWAPNVHFQTVIASYTPSAPVNCTRMEINTPDDDFLELDVIDLDNEQPVVALFHGLEGSSERYYIRNLMNLLKEEGFSSVALNFRGCGSRMNRQKRLYHSGETNDYQTLFEWIKDQFQDREIYGVGFSLGANAMIKSLGEEGSAHPLSRAVAVSPPYDLGKGSLDMNKGFNKLYQKRFIQTLTQKTELKRKHHPDIPIFTGSTIYEFDDQITAQVHGFKDADDYYTRSSSGQFIPEVRKPLLIIHSKADSLCPLKYAPLSDLNDNPHIHTHFTAQGGHVGFIGSPAGWLNNSILKWLKA